jgi:hypothetical protein
MMRNIKTVYEFLSESDSMSLKRERIEDTEHGVSFGWMLNGKEIVEMLVDIENGRASIVLYSRYKHIQSESGMGYRFIKMCIDELLKEGNDVVSSNTSRSPGANMVWDKLAMEYKVEDSVHRGSPCKIIYSK